MWGARVPVSRDSRPYFIVPILETPPTWRARSPYLCPPGTGWPSYTPGHCVPFPSPLTTRRATVEVLHAASTRQSVTQQVTVTVTSRLAVHRHSVRLGAKHLEDFFLQLSRSGHSLNLLTTTLLRHGPYRKRLHYCVFSRYQGRTSAQSCSSATEGVLSVYTAVAQQWI
jgi:hypothetical protein